MRSGFKFTFLALPLVLLAGCSVVHRHAAPPPAAQAPSAPPAQMASLIAPMPPLFASVKPPTIKLDTATPPEENARVQTPPPHRQSHHHKTPPADTAHQESESAAASSASQAAATQQIASGQPAESSPIGQLSTANDNTDTAGRHAILTLIDSTENTLNGIKRPLSGEEQKLATQIRTFLTRARDALKADDLDGARTLSTKAHLLLEELTKS